MGWRPDRLRYSYDLPADVFGPGELKPTRPKRKVTKRADSLGMKRSYEASGVEVCLSDDFSSNSRQMRIGDVFEGTQTKFQTR